MMKRTIKWGVNRAVPVVSLHQGVGPAAGGHTQSMLSCRAGLVSICIVLQIAGFEDDPWWAGSKLIPYAAPVAERLREAAEDGIDLLQTTGDEQ